MSQVQQLLTKHLNIWTAAETEKKSGRGRASGSAGKVYGIQKLRGLILDLAVRGKLVPQDHNDEPASELLKHIHAEKAKLIAEGKLKKEKPLATIDDEEKPFDLPKGWQWARLNEFVLSIISGGTPSKNKPEYWNGGIPWASVKDLNVEMYLEKTEDYITEEGLVAGSKLSNKGDLIICTRMGLGKIAIAAMDVAINQDLKSLKLTSLLNVNYFIKFYSTLKIAGSGMTVAGIRQEELLGYCVPLPPLAEQHRIVAKVDELMVLCDQLEQQHSNAAEAHEKLVEHLLGTLTQAQNAQEFSSQWQRIYTHFDTLFTTEASIDVLKQTLLQLAVMGKLVPQDPNDEPASELLNRIQAKKAKHIAEGKLKKEKLLAPISSDEKPFELPKGWEWKRLGELVTFEYGDNLPESKRTNSGEYPVYGSNGIVGTHEKAFVNSKCIVIGRKGSAGALNLSLSSGCCVTDVAYYCIPPSDLDLIFTFKLFHTLGLDDLGKGIKPGLNRNDAYGLILAVPPAKEQSRIVAKVDELMLLCDQLKTRIQQASKHQQQLADVLVAQATA